MELERTWGGMGSVGPPLGMSEEDLGGVAEKGGFLAFPYLHPLPPEHVRECSPGIVHPGFSFPSRGFLWLLPGSAKEHGMQTSSWAGAAVMPLKLGLVLLWQEMSDQAFILRLRKPGPGGARGSLLAFPWGRRHHGGSVRAQPPELGRA